MRRIAIAAFLFSLLLFTTFFPEAAGSEEAASAQVVETDGSALIAGQDLARARSEAIRNALHKAVELVAGQWIPPQDAARKDKDLKEKIYDRAEGFVRDFRIISEISAPDVYTVTVRATVFAESIRNDLQGIGLIRPSTLKPPVTGVSLIVLGIRDYGDYVRCRETLKEQIPAFREVTIREAAWGMIRFDIAAEGSVETVAVRLREKMSWEILHQDDRVLEVNLR
jgi:hypothetical protein